MRLLAALVAAHASCGPRPTPVPIPAASSVDVSHGLELVNAQFRAAKGQDEEGLFKTLAPTGMMLWPRPHTFAEGSPAGILATLLQLDPHDEWKNSRLEHTAIVGNADVLVAQFGVVTDKFVNEGVHADATVESEVTEVFSRDAEWKAIAMIGGALRDLRSSETLAPFPGATDAGPLSAMLDPKAALKVLRDDAVVVALTRLGRGHEAREVLEHTPTMSIVGSPRELRAQSWGIAQAYLDAKTPAGSRRVVGQVIGIVEGGAWRVVSVHYLSL